MIPVLHGVWSAGGVVGDFEHIETQTVGAGGAASITFSSIPGTYKHLQIRCIVNKTTVTDWISLRFNGDSGNNYAWHLLTGNGTTASSSAGTSSSSTYPTILAATNANIFGAAIIDILDYSSTSKHKTVRSLNGYDANGAGQITLSSAPWMISPIAAINSILISGATNMTQHTTFALYGVK